MYIHKPMSTMCLNAITQSSWSRARHWSAPEKLRGDKIPVEAEPFLPVLSWDMPLSLEEEFEALNRSEPELPEPPELEDLRRQRVSWQRKRQRLELWRQRRTAEQHARLLIQSTEVPRVNGDPPRVSEDQPTVSDDSLRVVGDNPSRVPCDPASRGNPTPEPAAADFTVPESRDEIATTPSKTPPAPSTTKTSESMPPVPTLPMDSVDLPEPPDPLLSNSSRSPDSSSVKASPSTSSSYSSSTFTSWLSLFSVDPPDIPWKWKRKSRPTLQWMFSMLLSLSILLRPACAEICKDMDIKNGASEFEQLRNCTVIEGFLHITLVDPDRFGWNENMSFPNLREVTDYVLLYRANGIKSLEKLFPNLAVIRGNNLIMDYALAIYQNDDLEEVGLVGLTQILRGGVRIEKNPNLCYVHTIDWKRILNKDYYRPDVMHFDENQDPNMCADFCSTKCPLLPGSERRTHACWSKDKCQKVTVNCPNNYDENMVCYTGSSGDLEMTCDSQCIGGCGGATPEDCFACKNVRWPLEGGGAGCRESCAAPYLELYGWRCVHESECRAIHLIFNEISINQRESYKIHDGKCLPDCPPETEKNETGRDAFGNVIWVCRPCNNCRKDCQGHTISSLEDLKRFEGCTQITGDLKIQIGGENAVKELNRAFRRVERITGNLELKRSFPIISLDFFERLDVIEGSTHGSDYSLYIYDNENLQKLFPRNVTIYKTRMRGVREPGKAFIHYNPNLCIDEIKKVVKSARLSNTLAETSADISLTTNGDKAVCSHETFPVTVIKNDDLALLRFKDFRATILEQGPQNNFRALLGYEIHYREISQATYDARNLTKHAGRDACGGDDWKIVDKSPTDVPDAKFMNNTETEFITVKPYTHYAVFVKTKIIRDIEGSKRVRGAQSEIIYFLTDESVPSKPRAVKWMSTNYSSMNITWQPPASPNGIIHHYEIFLEREELDYDRVLNDRPFCEEDYKVNDVLATKPIVDIKPKEPPVSIANVTDVCDCRTCHKGGKSKVVNKGEKLDEEKFLDAIINEIFHSNNNIQMTSRRRRRRDVESPPSLGANSLLGTSTEETEEDTNKTGLLLEDDGRPRSKILLRESIALSFSGKSTLPRPYSQYHVTKDKKKIYHLYSAEVEGDKQFIFVPHLKHFGRYRLYLRACHKPNDENYQRCSDFVHLSVRTDPKPYADDIVKPVESDGGRNKTEKFWLRWEPPADPNEIIVNYNIRIKNKGPDDAGSLKDCITAKQFLANNKMFELKVPGSYYVSVQAVSTAGPGNWTEWVFVSVTDQSHSVFLLSILLPIFLILFILIGVCLYYMCNKNKSKQEQGVYSSNKNYMTTDYVYQQDEWEVDRTRCVYDKELGNGAFGKVYEGIYSAPDGSEIKVAVKTVLERATIQQKLTFLQEASVMKEFNTEHVVKLIGVVSQGQPQLVMMELMINGDLKNYLRSLRPDAENNPGRLPPTVEETLRMGLQIADGMAYLSVAKRFVHRDIAARNCMVSGEFVVKIGDFGMAREVYATDYYRKGDKGEMPIRWMSPESLRDGVFTVYSDVWSFGVVLWEMVTLAEQPYQGLSNEEVLKYIRNGHTMEEPQNCPRILFTLMRDCWQQRPFRRPTFLDICKRLQDAGAADERFVATSYFTSEDGQAAYVEQENKRAAEAREIEENVTSETPLTSNGNGSNGGVVHFGETSSDNGHLVSTLPAVDIREFNRDSWQRSPTNIIGQDSSGSSRSKNWSAHMANGLKKIRHKSGSASGEA